MQPRTLSRCGLLSTPCGRLCVSHNRLASGHLAAHLESSLTVHVAHHGGNAAAAPAARNPAGPWRRRGCDGCRRQRPAAGTRRGCRTRPGPASEESMVVYGLTSTKRHNKRVTTERFLVSSQIPPRSAPTWARHPRSRGRRTAPPACPRSLRQGQRYTVMICSTQRLWVPHDRH